jgi:hypothetical protein
VDEGHQATERLLQKGRPSTAAGRANPDGGTPTPTAHPQRVELQNIMRRYDLLGDEPPKFKIAANDDAHKVDGAHTIDRHGPDIPLRRDPSMKTIEGRIYGDHGWRSTENWSIQWTDHTTMNREINQYVQQNWTKIRSDLAMESQHVGAFDAHHRVGVGYYNNGMYGAGPRQAQYGAASLVRITIQLAEGVDPPQPFILTAFPAGMLPPGLL